MNIADPGYAIDVNNTPGIGDALNGIKGCACVSELSLFDHGNCGNQTLGSYTSPTADDIKKLCKSLCEGATIKFYGCSVFLGGTPANIASRQKLIDQWMNNCPKIRRLRGCTGSYDYKFRWGVPATHCDACKREPGVEPDCKGEVLYFPNTEAPSLLPVLGLPIIF